MSSIGTANTGTGPSGSSPSGSGPTGSGPTGSGVVLVTGGAGYIGSHACKALAQAGFVPVTYDNLATGNRWAVRWGPFEPGDILDTARLHEVLRRHRPVAILHFAALSLVGESVRDPARYYRVNVGGAIGLLDAARVHDVAAFVFSSTCAVYGAPDRLPIVEATPPLPLNPYGASKLMIERLLSDHEAAYGMRHMALRYFNAAGADPEGEIGERRDTESHLVPLALDAAAGRRPPLQLFGTDYPTPDGTAVRDYIHVTDLAEAHVRALRHLQAGGGSRTLNLGTGQGYSVRAVLEAVQSVTGRPVPHETAPRRAGDAPELVADPAAARALLGADLTRRSDLATIVATAFAWQSGPTYARSFTDGLADGRGHADQSAAHGATTPDTTPDTTVTSSATGTNATGPDITADATGDITPRPVPARG